MGHIVQPAQGVSQGVYIAHAGPGEGKARPVGGRQQLLPGPEIGSVGTGGWEILKNGRHRLPGKASGLPGVIKSADVGLHCMGQGVQAGLRRDTGRQGHQRRVQNGPPWDQTQIIHRILVVGLVRNHGGDGGLRPGPGCGGYRCKGDDFSADLQKPLQLPHRAVGPGQPGRCGLGCVHGTAPTDGHHAVAPLRPELGHDLLHRLNFGLAVTPWKPLQAGSFSAMAVNSGAAHWRRLATIIGFLHPASASSSGSLCRLPAPVMHSGLRQGSTRAPRPKQA